MATSAGRNTFSQWQTCVSLTLPVLCTHECSSCCTCRVGPSKHAIHWPNIGTSFHHESSRCVRSYEIPSSPISFSRKKTTAFAIPRATGIITIPAVTVRPKLLEAAPIRIKQQLAARAGAKPWRRCRGPE